MDDGKQHRPGPWSGGDLPSLLTAVDDSPLPVAVVELPTEHIRAISASALDLIGHDRSVVGRSVEDITADPPTGGFDLIRAGRLSGYETTRSFVGAEGTHPVRVWVRALSEVPPVSMALTILSRSGGQRAGLTVLDPSHERPAVIGTADRTLTIDRISADVEVLLGATPGQVLHQPILRFVDESESGTLLLALAEATATGRGTSTSSTVRRADGTSLRVAVSIVPMAPAPSFAFSLTEESEGTHDGAAAATRFIESIGQIVDTSDAARNVGEQCRPVPGLERLTTRELHIVGRLMDGDRVPTIAASLFLSQSTVRNHLSSVFAKLRVSSQQELISLLRQPKKDGPSTP